MYSFSTELLGDTARVYLTPIGPDGSSRSTGSTLADFSIRLVNPSLEDITSETDISVTEYETDGSYRFLVPLPTTGEGSYGFRVVDPFGDSSFASLQAYSYPPYTQTNDSTAQVELSAYDGAGDPVETLAIEDLDLRIYNPSMVNVADESYVGATLTKIQAGRFLLEWDCSSEEGEWFVDAVSTDYFAGGQQAVWRYEIADIAASPAITDVDVSADGLTVTVTVTAGDAPFVSVRLLSSEGDVRDDDVRAGSGILALGRLVNENGMVVAYGTDGYGRAHGQPVAYQVIGTVFPVGGADDNVKPAVKTMKAYAVYWAATGRTDYGRFLYDDPVVIQVRWDAVREEFVGPTGDREMSNAVCIVDRDLAIHGVLMLGTLDDVLDNDDPKNNDGAYEIRKWAKTPDFKGRLYLRQVWL